MKKTLIFILALFLSNLVNAQLKVFDNGVLSVGTTEYNSSSVMMIDGQDYYNGLYCKNARRPIFIRNQFTDPDIHDMITGISIHNYLTGNLDPYGIYILSFGTNNLESVGIHSEGGNSTRFSCGVFGGLSGSYITNGSGIIGSSSYSHFIDSSYSGRYAGYFSGDVRVTGTLYGSLLTPSGQSGDITSSSFSNRTVQIVNRDTNIDNESVSDKLSHVNLLKIYDNISDKDDGNVSSENISKYKELIHKLENDTTLTDDEIEIIDRELASLEETLPDSMRYQTKRASVSYGLAADQLKAVYPELVYEDQNGNVSINYIEMVPLLVQSINELKTDIDELKKENSVLKSELSGNDPAVKSRDEVTNIESVDIDILSLSQNDPNPFSERTTISLTVPENVNTAAVFFYDMSGKQIDKRIITERGNTQISVTSAEFTEGMYLYSLIADGKVIATRKMILTK